MNKIETEKEFIELIQQHERVIYKVCSFYVSEELLMADLYQEVVYNLWKGFTKFRNECAVSTWIYRVALNTCISGLRKEGKQLKNRIPLSTLEEKLTDSDNAELEEKFREMYQLINRLKTLEKAVILLYLENKSYQEIAEITGLTLSNVATKLKRTKEKLKAMSNS